MRGLALLGLSLAVVLASCATKPVRAPVLPQPPLQLQSADCAALGPSDDVPPLKLNPHPYGWGLVRYDVERGAVTKAEIVASSPSGMFDAVTVADVKRQRFSSLGTAHGCMWFTKWE